MQPTIKFAKIIDIRVIVSATEAQVTDILPNEPVSR